MLFLKVAQISNALQQEQAQRLNRIYEGNVESSKIYDRALREGRNDVTKEFQNAWKDRQTYDTANQMNTHYNFDPVSGQLKWKPGSDAGTYEQIVKNSGGTPGDMEGYYKILDSVQKAHPPKDDKDAEQQRDYAWNASGLGERIKKTTKGYNVIPSSTTETGIPGKKYGGPQKRKFGGFSNHQLKKFVANSYSK